MFHQNPFKYFIKKIIISSVFYQNLESYKTDSKLMDFNGAWRALVIHLTSLLLYCIHWNQNISSIVCHFSFFVTATRFNTRKCWTILPAFLFTYSSSNDRPEIPKKSHKNSIFNELWPSGGNPTLITPLETIFNGCKLPAIDFLLLSHALITIEINQTKWKRWMARMI